VKAESSLAESSKEACNSKKGCSADDDDDDDDSYKDMEKFIQKYMPKA
jgi:hypothetical protein